MNPKDLCYSWAKVLEDWKLGNLGLLYLNYVSLATLSDLIKDFQCMPKFVSLQLLTFSSPYEYYQQVRLLLWNLEAKTHKLPPSLHTVEEKLLIFDGNWYLCNLNRFLVYIKRRLQNQLYHFQFQLRLFPRNI